MRCADAAREDASDAHPNLCHDPGREPRSVWCSSRQPARTLLPYCCGGPVGLRNGLAVTAVTGGTDLVALVVEDDPGDVLMITEALERGQSGWSIHVTGDGQEALDFLQRRTPYENAPVPDLILLDLNMPRLDGRQALALIKADQNLRHIPIVVFTTSAAQEDVLGAYQNHANAYVTKPIDLDDLEDVVGQIDHFYTAVAQRPRTASLS